MNGLLTDEANHLLAQLGVLDQRDGLGEYVDEPPFASRQQQMQHVAGVGDQGLVGHPVDGRLVQSKVTFRGSRTRFSGSCGSKAVR